MQKRFAHILWLGLTLAPVAALADDTAAPTPTPTTQSAAATGLGPDATSTGGGGSNADAGSLQPAGTSSLQTTPAQATDTSGGTPVPAVKLFEAPTPADNNLRVLLAQEADGTPQASETPGDATSPVLDLAIAGVVVVVGLLAWIFRRRLQMFWQRVLRSRA